MQRISLKHFVFLALLVMSMSLVPSAIVHSVPEDGIDTTRVEPSVERPVLPSSRR